jgi:hypothetical protein
MLILLIILVLFAAAGGGYGHRRYGYAGWSPLGIILTVMLILFLTGNL